MPNLSRNVFIIAVLLCLGHAAYYYPLLPDRVASHFGPSGRPDAWSSKDAFVAIYLFAVAVIAVVFSGIGLLLRRTPATLINLPNRDYWLSPERSSGTIAFLSRQFLWFGSATLLLMLDIFHQAFMVHLGRARGLEHPVVSLVIYVAFTAIWSIRLIGRFARRT